MAGLGLTYKKHVMNGPPPMTGKDWTELPHLIPCKARSGAWACLLPCTEAFRTGGGIPMPAPLVHCPATVAGSHRVGGDAPPAAGTSARRTRRA